MLTRQEKELKLFAKNIPYTNKFLKNSIKIPFSEGGRQKTSAFFVDFVNKTSNYHYFYISRYLHW